MGTCHFTNFAVLQLIIWATTWQNQQNECGTSENSDQPGQCPSLSTCRKLGSLSTHWAHSEDWSDWADAQADLSFRWAPTHFVGFVMSRLIYMHVNLMKRSVCKTTHMGKMISACMSQDCEMAITKLMIFFSLFFFFFHFCSATLCTEICWVFGLNVCSKSAMK